MAFIQTFLLAVFVAFIGFILPGMINMTALKTSLEHNRKEAFLFAAGAASVILVQAFIAVTFAKFLARNPQILEYLTYAAVVVFLGLSVMFFRQARRQFRLKEIRLKQKNSYRAGLTMASMNMLAIPFFLGYSTILEAESWLQTAPPHNIIFALGAAAGAALLFAGYVLFAEYIRRRVQFIARNINYILSGLFLLLAVLTIFNILSGGAA